MDTKTMQCIWILNINDAWKNRLVKYLKTENFSVSIGQETGSIDQKSGKVKFWKTMQVNAETPQSTLCYE